MKDAVDLLNERIADLKERNTALVEALEELQVSLSFGEGLYPLVIYIDKVLKEHGGE